jgi:HD-like signal output (HDOD) protein
VIHTMSLIEILQEHLAAEDLQLPVFPLVALQLQEMLSSEDADLLDIASRIASDQVLASQFLRVANSAFFSGLSKVATIQDAIMRLGTRQSIDLILLITQRQQYNSKDKFLAPYVEALWKHAASTAAGCKWAAERLGYPSIAQEAFLAGLLHDIGNLFLLRVLENAHASGKHDIDLSKPVLAEVLDSMHTVQGALLLKRWNLPELYCEIVRTHHDPVVEKGSIILNIVRLVDMACHKLGIGLIEDPDIVLAATADAQTLGVSELMAAQLEIMLEDFAASGGMVV